MYSGGTEVTVFGRHLNSVAEPRITLTVIISAINDANSTSYENESTGVSEHEHTKNYDDELMLMMMMMMNIIVAMLPITLGSVPIFV